MSASIIRERILITVKTYPTLSKTHGELVCTAGVREDGTWIRLYPVPFRRLGEAEQYKKYDWISCDVVKREGDPRPESYCPINHEQLVSVGHVGTESKWRERRRLLLQNCEVFTRMQDLIDRAKANTHSLGIFKPSKIIDFKWKLGERDWDAEKVAQMRSFYQQGELFSEETWRNSFELVNKIPYDFSYRFEDADGKESNLRILDWEVGALYRNCLANHESNEQVALEKVRAKYFDQFLKTDLHFFVGTTQQFHSYAPNPWMIIGAFPIPHESQLNFDF